METFQTTCCIVGGGPAGIMLGFLLARQGIDVTVLEKHADFFRDFRGDTIHPSTLQVIHELGLLDEFLKLPHQKVHQLEGVIGGENFTVADLSHLPVVCPYIVLMPQWDFLNFIAEQAKKYPNFRLRMQTEAVDLIQKDGKTLGLVAKTANGQINIRSLLTVGADGRHSTLREKAKMTVIDSGAPIDVLWLRLSHKPSDPVEPMAHFDRGKMLVMIYRGDYWQSAYVIAKNSFDTVKNKGLEAFRADIAKIAPFTADRVNEIKNWDDVKLLSVAVDHLKTWHQPGLLCIGDAAHAMSPVGGVGINLAIQDAIAAANILTAPLKTKHMTERDLRRVQCRRAWPARIIQRIQVFMHNRLFKPLLTSTDTSPLKPPAFLKWTRRFPVLQRIPARIVGMGFLPEHIR